MEPKRASDKTENIDDYIFTECNEVVIHEPIVTKSSGDMIGYIDKYGFFIIDLEVEGIDLLSTSITDDAGFFDKIIIESNFKAWISNIKETFEIFKSIYNKIHANSRFKLVLFNDKYQAYKDEDLFDHYFSKIKIT